MKHKKIIYGVAGEGMGHAIRSSVVIQYLLDCGHDVKVVSSNRAADFLIKKFKKRTSKITGLTISYKNNKVMKLNTIIENLAASKQSVETYGIMSKLFSSFNPDLVITDFEPWTCSFARYKKIPVVSIDNIQMINRCKLDKEIKGVDYQIAKTIVKSMTPKCDWYMVTSFFDAPVKKEKTTIYSPILRPTILNAKSKDEGYILVYQTSDSATDLINSLKKSPNTFIVYGYKKDITETEIDGNLIIKPFSEDSFVFDLASSSAVISGGSFTVISECLYLKKPILSYPVEGQFEQELNAHYIEKIGYGRRGRKRDGEIKEFIESIDKFKTNLKGYNPDFKLYHDLNRIINSLK